VTQMAEAVGTARDTAVGTATSDTAAETRSSEVGETINSQTGEKVAAPTRTSNRLSVNLASDVADALRTYVRERGVTVTEAIRRAISLLVYVDTAIRKRDAKILISEKGEMRELVFFQ
jgi:hypothetical protein